jgi:hypothetical protein
MRWYRAAKKAGLKTYFRRKRTAEQTKAWRRKYQREYRRRISNETAKGNQAP